MPLVIPNIAIKNLNAPEFEFPAELKKTSIKTPNMGKPVAIATRPFPEALAKVTAINKPITDAKAIKQKVKKISAKLKPV